MVPSKLYVGALTACVLLSAAAEADLVLDDFDVPSFDLPSNGPSNEPVIVGDLNLFRYLQFSDFGAGAIGHFDSATSAPSQLTATLVEADLVDDPFVQIDQRLLYFRDYSPNSLGTIPFDISEDGRNTALVLDFLRLEGARPPDRLIVLVSAHGTSFEYRHFDLPLTSEPFSLVIPFSDFRLRGGGPPPPVPAFVDTQSIDVKFQSGQFAESYELALDRIRVTSVVPEPSTGGIVLAALILALPLLLKGSAVPMQNG